MFPFNKRLPVSYSGRAMKRGTNGGTKAPESSRVVATAFGKMTEKRRVASPVVRGVARVFGKAVR